MRLLLLTLYCVSSVAALTCYNGMKLLRMQSVGQSTEECAAGASCYNMTSSAMMLVDAVKAGCSTWRCMAAKDRCISTYIQLVPVSFCCCSTDRCNVGENGPGFSDNGNNGNNGNNWNNNGNNGNNNNWNNRGNNDNGNNWNNNNNNNNGWGGNSNNQKQKDAHDKFRAFDVDDRDNGFNNNNGGEEEVMERIDVRSTTPRPRGGSGGGTDFRRQPSGSGDFGNAGNAGNSGGSSRSGGSFDNSGGSGRAGNSGGSNTGGGGSSLGKEIEI